MYKKYFSILIAIISINVFSQNSRFIYQVSMKPDSTNRGEIKNELARLDVSPEKSIFYGEKRVQRDSLMEKMRATRNFDRNAMQNLRSNIDFIIEKDFSKETTTFKGRIGRDQYEYEEDRKMDWKILPQTLKIGEYEAQKAITNFGGRKWIAWFTQEIPLQDGPYKFRGLPGLIIKVEDEKGDYSFDLMQTKKITDFPSFENRTTPIKVKRVAYEKQESSFKKDPLTYITNAFGQGGAGGHGGGIRMQLDPDDRKQMEDRLKEEVRKNNNPIELSK